MSKENEARHIPRRMCIICRKRFDKGDLIRVVKANGDCGDNIALDTAHRIQARGVYICKSQACVEKLVKQKGLNRVFSTNVSEEIYSQISLIK